MEEISGYVSETLLKLFNEGEIHHLSLLRKPLKGIDVHVTLSPACPERSSPEPDYNVMIGDLIYLRERCSSLSRPKLQRVIDFLILETKHTPQGDQSTGVKKEET